MAVNVEDFNRVVAGRFAYLVHEHGFDGPDTSEQGYAGYTAHPWSVWVVLETGVDKRVDTFMRFNDGQDELTAPLGSLVVKAGLGGLQAVGGNARTRHSMEKSVGMQADALKRVLPVLRGERGRELMAPSD